MKVFRSALAVAAAASILPAPAPLQAQDVQYETVTKVELPGVAGRAMRFAARLGGGSTDAVETTYIKGRKMRTDIDQSSTIVDLESGRVIFLEHGPKTYSVTTFAEMAERAQEAATEMRRDGREVSGADDAETRFSFRFAVDRPSERQRVAGYDAERFFLTMQAEGEYRPEGAAAHEPGGTLVLLTDMWTSRDIPAFQARSTFLDASAQQYAEASSRFMEGLAAAFADDPRLKVAFEQSASEARKIEGMPVRTVTSFVVVAPDQQFDRARVTDPRPQGGSAARQAGRSALGRLGAAARAAAGRQQQEAEAPAEEETQATILTVTSEIRNVSTRSLDAKLFEIPDGYREQPIGMP